MTVNEAAKKAGVKPDTIRHWIHRKKLKAVKRGRDWWIEPAALEAVEVGRRKGRKP